MSHKYFSSHTEFDEICWFNQCMGSARIWSKPAEDTKNKESWCQPSLDTTSLFSMKLHYPLFLLPFPIVGGNGYLTVLIHSSLICLNSNEYVTHEDECDLLIYCRFTRELLFRIATPWIYPEWGGVLCFALQNILPSLNHSGRQVTLRHQKDLLTVKHLWIYFCNIKWEWQRGRLL